MVERENVENYEVRRGVSKRIEGEGGWCVGAEVCSKGWDCGAEDEGDGAACGDEVQSWGQNLVFGSRLRVGLLDDLVEEVDLGGADDDGGGRSLWLVDEIFDYF